MLSRRIILMLLAVAVIGSVLVGGMLRFIILPKFHKLEHKQAVHDMQSTKEVLARELDHLSSLCHDWAAWDDSYEFVQNRNEDFAESNLLYVSFEDNQLNTLFYVNDEGECVWGESYDLETGEPIELDILSEKGFPADHPWLMHEAQSSLSGLTQTSHGLMFLAAQPIVTSDLRGPARGTLFMGQLLTDDLMETMRRQTGTRFEFGETVPANEPIPLKVDAENAYTLLVNDTFPLLEPDVNIRLWFPMPRDIMMQGMQMLHWITSLTITLGLSFVLFLHWNFMRVVVEPVKKLKEHALAIAGSDSPLPPLYPDRNDEIGVLSNTLDDMVERLFHTRSDMLEMSFHSGQSEMASTFLHNVRNSLSPLAVHIEMLRSEIRRFAPDKLKHVKDQLASADTPDNVRCDLLEWLELYTQQCSESIEKMKHYVESIEKMQRSLEMQLSIQERWTGAEPVLESITLQQLAADLSRHIQATRSQRLTLETGGDEQAMFRVNRVTLLMLLARLAALLQDEDDQYNMSTSMRILLDTTEQPAHLHVLCTSRTAFSNGVSLEDFFAREESDMVRNEWHWIGNTIHQFEGTIDSSQDGRSMGIHIPVLLHER